MELNRSVILEIDNIASLNRLTNSTLLIGLKKYTHSRNYLVSNETKRFQENSNIIYFQTKLYALKNSNIFRFKHCCTSNEINTI